MSHIFHIWILAYLVFIFVGCGYKANPFYGENLPQENIEQEIQVEPTQKKKVLFQEISSQPIPSHEEYRD